MTHPIAMMKTCTAALLFVAALLLAQVEPASAAPYNGDIGETRFTSVDRWDNQSTFILKRYAKPNGGGSGGVVLVYCTQGCGHTERRDGVKPWQNTVPMKMVSGNVNPFSWTDPDAGNFHCV